MFSYAKEFNQDLSGWNVNSAISLTNFAIGATKFEEKNKPKKNRPVVM
jgi:surface protein